MSATTDPTSTAVLTIAIDALTDELRQQLLDLGAAINDVGSLDEPLEITFPPIAGPTGEVSSITIREPTAAQIAQWDNLVGTPALMKAISICGTVPIVVVEQLRARQFTQAVKRIEAFLA